MARAKHGYGSKLTTRGPQVLVMFPLARVPFEGPISDPQPQVLHNATTFFRVN